ncbi:secretin receptor-like [Physella acuta]|uniref:secretin receptor-like n=1 Tax=Physella acuta TaxID=109671 RepID=UPI0027DC5AD9|nr:secretin receptor-like [Physella acuta]
MSMTSVWTGFCPLLLLFLVQAVTSFDHLQEQRIQLKKAEFDCFKTIMNVTRPDDGELYCEPAWDNIMCWPNYTRAGETATQYCAWYIDGFNIREKASRMCLSDGTWKIHHYTNSSWTDFGNCMIRHDSVPEFIKQNMPIVSKIATVGYSLSLGALLVATSIMVCFRRLHCQRNTIHINLFISFMFRAAVSVLKNGLLVQGFALPKDVVVKENGELQFIKDDIHWECKLLTTLWHYSLSANYMWIFVEGLYLHTLIFFAVFSQSRKFFKIYIVIGWVLPMLFLILWVVLRVHLDDLYCWNMDSHGVYWALHGPIVVSISINFFFFLNIIRMLFTKIRNCNTRDPGRYRKLAKSTLVLIPLFGVYFLYFFIMSHIKAVHLAVIHIYIETVLNSFQGTIIAFLFCFLNGEVRAEVMKRWNRHWLRRQSIASGRSSRAFSTTSFYIGRDRTSVSQGIPLTEAFSKDGTTTTTTTPPHSPFNNNNSRIFHKVASMPKMPFSAIALPKPIPRVSSSPKVTFSETLAEVDRIPPTPNGGPVLKSKTHANGDASRIDETTTLLCNGVAPATEDLTQPGEASSHHAHSGPTWTVKYRSSPEDGAVLTTLNSVSHLPPLLDEEEE